MVKEIRGYSPTEGRERLVVLPKQYQARIISGNFDSGKPLDLTQVRQRIAENNPVEAYAKMHKQWQGVRKADWENDKREFSDQILGWAGGRAANLLPQLQSGVSTNFLEGLKTIGLEIADPANAEKDTLKTYFAETFYPQFASKSSEDEDRSVGNLVNTFFNAAKQSPEDAASVLDAQKLSRVRAQVEALKPVLEPILKKDTFEKFEDVLEARFAAANGELAIVRNERPSASLIDNLKYFEPNQTPYIPKLRQTGVLNPTPASTPEPAAVVYRPRPRSAAPTPTEEIPKPVKDREVLIDIDPYFFPLELGHKLLMFADINKKQAMVASISPKCLLLGESYLLSETEGDVRVEVKDPGRVEITDGGNGIKETGVTLFVEEGGKGREIPNLNLSVLTTEDGITVTVDDVEEMPGYPDWNRQLAQKALAGINARLVSKINKHLKDIRPGWAVSGKIIIKSGRFKISFAKTLDDNLEPATPPPFPREAIVFPTEPDGAEPIAVS